MSAKTSRATIAMRPHSAGIFMVLHDPRGNA
jgi:hypothetical protein